MVLSRRSVSTCTFVFSSLASFFVYSIRLLHCRKTWERFVCLPTDDDDDDDDGNTNAAGAVNGDDGAVSLYSRIKSNVLNQEPFVFELMETEVGRRL